MHIGSRHSTEGDVVRALSKMLGVTSLAVRSFSEKIKGHRAMFLMKELNSPKELVALLGSEI